MNRLLTYAVLAASLGGCSTDAGLKTGASESPATPTLTSGIDLQYIDNTVRPQDDLYRYLNGKWLDTFQIPADQGRYGTFIKLRDDTLEQSRTIIEKLTHTGNLDSETKKIASLYTSFIDEPAVESLGDKPIRPLFQSIDAITRKAQIPALIAKLNTFEQRIL